MKRSHLIVGGSLFLVGTLTTACATGTGGTQQATMGTCGADYSCIKDMALQYRQQAEQLSALAQRYEHEAAFKRAQAGHDAEEVRRQHELAREYSSEARKADELAQEYRRQLPHNMVN